MELGIGDIIRSERKKRGWDQQELARLVGGIGQQTVSRWERGLSRPKRPMVGELARILRLPAVDLLKAAGYVNPTADTPEQSVPHVRPRLTTLRLSELAPDKFEQFTVDLGQLLFPKANVYRYGGPGHKQEGIDVIALRGKMTEAIFQCKREENFGPAKVRAAVKAVTVPAKHHFLMLTRVASPASRTEIARYPTWKLLDVEDISQIVRLKVRKDAAVRLIDTYFPGWREPFLGVLEPGPWLTIDEFFRPYIGDQVYTHDWPLVGRDNDLAGIESFLEDVGHAVGVVMGRGGIGKTRLLRAAAMAAQATHSMSVRLLAVSGDVRPEHFELLPPGPLLVVIDDAHERSDMADLLMGIRRANVQAKALVSLRPYGMTQLTYDLKRVGVRASDLPTWPLDDLKTVDAEALALHILGSAFNQVVVRRLAALTTDCPLITVVGASLLKRGLLDPSRLEADESIRDEILVAFRNALVADPAVGDPELRRATVEAVSILQPLRLDETVFQEAMATLTGVAFDRVMPHIRGLVDAGILLRRGDRVRIVPDLLGDVVLAEACLDRRSRVDTGYIGRARRAADGQALQNVFVNASRVDWQARRQEPGTPSLVDALWTGLEKEFQASGMRARLSLVKLLQKTAFFQPERALALAQWALEHPTDSLEDPDNPLSKLYPPSYADVIHEVAPVLKYCAYTLEYLPAAVGLLWKLAQSDTRPTNQFPDHPMRALEDLASYETNKPLVFNEAIVDAAERWLADSGGGDLQRSPFEVLEPLLATEGSDQFSDGFSLSFRPYRVNLSTVRPLRERVIGLAMGEARQTDASRAVKAVNAIGASLHYPIGMFGREIDSKERDNWTPIFVDTVRQLAQVASDPVLDPVVAIALRQALGWHARYNTGPANRASLKTLARIPDDLEHELALLLFDGWGHILFEHRDDYYQAEIEKEARFRKLAEVMISHYSDAQIAELLAQRLARQQQAFGRGAGSPGQFVWTLVQTKPSIGRTICQTIVDQPESVLLEVLPVALSRLVAAHPRQGMSLARALVDTEAIGCVRNVAQSLGWSRGGRSELAPGEIALLERLAVDNDQWVRSAVVRAAQVLIETRRPLAIELLTRVHFADSVKVAEEVFSSFGMRAPIRWEELSARQQGILLEGLKACPSLDDYHITKFLSDLSKQAPAVVLKLLRDRVELSEGDHLDNYDPLPQAWHEELHMRSYSDFALVLAAIRDWIAAGLDSWRRRSAGAQMFKAVAATFDAAVIRVLDEGLQTGSLEQLQAVTSILREAPRSLFWDHVDFVRSLLGAAERFGEDCLKRVSSDLHAAMTSGIRSGTPGEPFPEDVDQRDKAATIANKLPPGSVEERFYRSIEQSAEASIHWSLEQDDRLRDGRDW